jgi:hypothetical protein
MSHAQIIDQFMFQCSVFDGGAIDGPYSLSEPDPALASAREPAAAPDHACGSSKWGDRR